MPMHRARADVAVLLAGHGRSDAPETADSVLAHVRALDERGAFRTVRAGFLKQAPYLPDAVARLEDAPRVVVVPFMTSNGYVTSHLMPRALGARAHDPRIVFADAVGTHPLIARSAAAGIAARMGEAGVAPADAHVLAVGHGTRRNPTNELATRRFLGAVLEALPPGVSGDVALLEHEPDLVDWHRRTDRRNVFAVPFLMAGGRHGRLDVPAGLGLDPHGPCVQPLSNGAEWIGPCALSGRRVWLSRPVGFSGAATDAAEARVLEALSAEGAVA